MEYEQVRTLATVQEIGRVHWDALGQQIVVEVRAGQPGGTLHTVFVGLAPEAAEELQTQLLLCLREKEDESGPMQ